MIVTMAALFGLVSKASIVTAAIVLGVFAVLTGAVSGLLAGLVKVRRRVLRPASGALGSLVELALGFLRAGAVVAVAVLNLTAVKAMAEDAPRADVPCPAPVVLEAGAEDAAGAAVWAAEDAAWTAAMTAALASLPDDGPGPLSEALLAAWTQVVLETGVLPADPGQIPVGN